MQTQYSRDPCGWSFETFRDPQLWTGATRHHRGTLWTAGLAIAALAGLAWLLAQLIW